MALVRELRSRGHAVPNLDPKDGGVNATVLFLLESPGPKAVRSGFISRDNPDPSAKNMSKELKAAGFKRSEVVLWNVVPYCVSTSLKNRNASAAQIRDAAPDTQAFIDALPRLRVVVFCGRRAQRAYRHLRLPAGVEAVKTFHTGAMAYNRQHCRADIQAAFAHASALLRPCPTNTVQSG